jgi:hypothetical protein
MKDLIPYSQYTFNRTIEGKIVKSKTDCLMINERIEAKCEIFDTNTSDHCIIVGKI